MWGRGGGREGGRGEGGRKRREMEEHLQNEQRSRDAAAKRTNTSGVYRDN